ncbi:ester hydrolase C11orf54 homolog isoform X3 [Megalobrama amblycephala]|uniref:ester hydrolase C11orf54 homolog isoform X3 n=1 Tax=Megalobrama amblycephala TaxID=75352 RepID=UPI00201441C5|nr:ester hydrolase C11orf54 homolog isoform X3 [Megalobrama amblycephala]
MSLSARILHTPRRMANSSKTEKFQLHVPNLEELCQVLESGLNKNFSDVKVSVTDCPDLTNEPFRFPVKGICGKPRITDVGGVPYLIPLVRLDKVYNMNLVSKEVELPGAFILGAGAVSSKTVGINGELMPLVVTEAEGRPAVNGSYFSTINPVNGKCVQEKYSDRFHDCDFGLLANLYACEGKPGKPRAFSICPLNTSEDVDNWLRHFEVSAPLIFQTVMVSKDPGLDLRVEHTHGFSHHGEGGHYYIDTTPNTVEYLGYFLPAELLYRIDRPTETHNVGRD